MEKIRLGVLGAADIAVRKFLPALAKCDDVTFAGVASRGNKDKAQSICDQYGGKVYGDYDALLGSDDIDAVYIPLPPALHAQWIIKALEAGKHVLSEKPFTISTEDTEKILGLADENGLTVFENYGFVYHDQIRLMKELLDKGEIGELRQVEAVFGFPKRDPKDFRNVKALGGGALLDAGGYVIKAATLFLGKGPRVLSSLLKESPDHDVDFWGSVLMCDEDKIPAQLSFGMDDSYRCSIRLWGSTGEMYSDRAFTAPADLAVPVIVKKGGNEEKHLSEASDQFLLSIERFAEAVRDREAAKRVSEEIMLQARLIQSAMEQDI